MKRILVLPNLEKKETLLFAANLIDILTRRGLNPVLEETVAENLKRLSLGRNEAELLTKINLAIVLGGDGSMLRAARKVYQARIPLLGVNFGRLGFLTQVENNQIDQALDKLEAGDYQIEERAMIEAEVIRDGLIVKTIVALNDLVVAKNSFTRTIRLKTWIDDEYFTTYPADGIIIATATGSTAYSLSAGGPILDPRMKSFLITPICAHALYDRPLVLSEQAQIKVVLDAGTAEVSLTADGQVGVALLPEDIIRFRRADTCAKLLRFTNQGLFKAFKSRLKEE